MGRGRRDRRGLVELGAMGLRLRPDLRLRAGARRAARRPHHGRYRERQRSDQHGANRAPNQWLRHRYRGIVTGAAGEAIGPRACNLARIAIRLNFRCPGGAATAYIKMAYRHIQYETGDRIARVILNRPRYRNAQSRVLLEEMDDAFTRANEDNDVRVIILSGAGEHFSSGHDLGTDEEKEDHGRRPFGKGLRALYARSRQLYLDNTLRWRDLDKPTIAQVHGYCIFGGWMIASAMDLIVASEDAQFLPALLQYFSIPWDLPIRKAKEILFQSRFVGADEACRLGFVNMVVPRAKLAEETTALARRIAESDRMTLRMLKFAINNAQDAMGFRTAVRNAHSHHLLLGVGPFLRDAGDERELPRRMEGVEQALKKTPK
jgi:enoyl-CoA hydratase/carnithine racemase